MAAFPSALAWRIKPTIQWYKEEPPVLFRSLDLYDNMTEALFNLGFCSEEREVDWLLWYISLEPILKRRGNTLYRIDSHYSDLDWINNEIQWDGSILGRDFYEPIHDLVNRL